MREGVRARKKEQHKIHSIQCLGWQFHVIIMIHKRRRKNASGKSDCDKITEKISSRERDMMAKRMIALMEFDVVCLILLHFLSLNSKFSFSFLFSHSLKSQPKTSDHFILKRNFLLGKWVRNMQSIFGEEMKTPTSTATQNSTIIPQSSKPETGNSKSWNCKLNSIYAKREQLTKCMQMDIYSNSKCYVNQNKPKSRVWMWMRMRMWGASSVGLVCEWSEQRCMKHDWGFYLTYTIKIRWRWNRDIKRGRKFHA